MNVFSFVLTAAVLLLVIIPTAVFAAAECSPAASNHVKATIDNKTLFSSCASVRRDVNSLLDVLKFPARDFLLFCRSPSCAKPVKSLVNSIPTDCLIAYHGSARNLSAEVSRLSHECAKVVKAADKTDEDYVYRYFLD
ncbi:hypothetical protein PR003_g24168 [Phytophthora rubi]|uniref:Elicitin n=1 Tax=Phytophthora rubi TaxID=129364 RepID=A0A6A3ITH2_9STRA|nr:hypothetical protein PR002_g23375 [Phytophthora rubi]KAE8985147.1 hypothetical protein PR001_g22977 [Phytophthora rubi]KAE9294819.1 hypothetical protein PR003_g24168 [Phytophthora rubi]